MESNDDKFRKYQGELSKIIYSQLRGLLLPGTDRVQLDAAINDAAKKLVTEKASEEKLKFAQGEAARLGQAIAEAAKADPKGRKSWLSAALHKLCPLYPFCTQKPKSA
jgi:hypothetical protein